MFDADFDSRPPIEVERIQAQLRATASRNFETVPVHPFTCYFNPDDSSPWSNYAIPNQPVSPPIEEALLSLQGTFVRHRRTPRFEFLADFAPKLAGLLEENGYERELEAVLMTCTPDSYRPLPWVEGFSMVQLRHESPVGDVQAFITIQRRSFGAVDSPVPSPEEAEHFWHRYASASLYLASLEGMPAAVGSLSAPHDEIAELAGIAVLPAFRRQGLGTAVTGYLAQAAFMHGLEAIFLTAADETAGRVYQKVGFRFAGSAYAYRLVEARAGEKTGSEE